jgi:hypothetical protein
MTWETSYTLTPLSNSVLPFIVRKYPVPSALSASHLEYFWTEPQAEKIVFVAQGNNQPPCTYSVTTPATVGPNSIFLRQSILHNEDLSIRQFRVTGGDSGRPHHRIIMLGVR